MRGEKGEKRNKKDDSDLQRSALVEQEVLCFNLMNICEVCVCVCVNKHLFSNMTFRKLICSHLLPSCIINQWLEGEKGKLNLGRKE